MSYIVLARKYRPRNFAEVYAQEHVTEILQNAILTNRIAHAYLFTGPRGVGKTSMARIMAKNLNCAEGPSITPCNVCHNCVEITSGTSTDVIEIDGASNTSVDDVRELQRELIYAPSQSKYKIYIIDEVHMLSKSAFNALLKTLEEPPENVLFIFATTEPHKVLPTIISRCQRYDFKRIPIEATVRRLKELTTEEKIEVDAESLHLIARKSDGSLRDALSQLDQVLSYTLNKVTIDKVREIFGLIPTQVFSNIMTHIAAKDCPALLKEIQSSIESGADLLELINNLMEFLRVVILRQLGIEPAEITREEYPLYDSIASLFSQNALLYMMSYLMQTRSEFKTSSNPQLIFEMVMVKLSKMDEMDDISRVIAELGKTPPATAQPGPIAAPPVQISSPETRVKQSTQDSSSQNAGHPVKPAISKATLTQETLDSHWDRLVQRIKHGSKAAGLALQDASRQVDDNGRIRLGIKGSMNLSAAQGKKDELIEIMGEYFSGRIRVEFELIESETPPRVEIHRKSIEELKTLDPALARYIEITDSQINKGN